MIRNSFQPSFFILEKLFLKSHFFETSKSRLFQVYRSWYQNLSNGHRFFHLNSLSNWVLGSKTIQNCYFFTNCCYFYITRIYIFTLSLLCQDGSKECDHPIDMNEYVDKILQVVFANAGRRYIVFSSFSPDICAMYVWIF